MQESCYEPLTPHSCVESYTRLFPKFRLLLSAAMPLGGWHTTAFKKGLLLPSPLDDRIARPSSSAGISLAFLESVADSFRSLGEVDAQELTTEDASAMMHRGSRRCSITLCSCGQRCPFTTPHGHPCMHIYNNLQALGLYSRRSCRAT